MDGAHRGGKEVGVRLSLATIYIDTCDLFDYLAVWNMTWLKTVLLGRIVMQSGADWLTDCEHTYTPLVYLFMCVKGGNAPSDPFFLSVKHSNEMLLSSLAKVMQHQSVSRSNTNPVIEGFLPEMLL